MRIFRAEGSRTKDVGRRDPDQPPTSYHLRPLPQPRYRIAGFLPVSHLEIQSRFLAARSRSGRGNRSPHRDVGTGRHGDGLTTRKERKDAVAVVEDHQVPRYGYALSIYDLPRVGSD